MRWGDTDGNVSRDWFWRENFVLRLLRPDGRSFRSMSRTKHHVRELEFEVESQVTILALKSY
jgi:hypothetical protein